MKTMKKKLKTMWKTMKIEQKNNQEKINKKTKKDENL